MEPFTGQISIFGFNFAPLNWATCSGQLVPISQYTALFSLLGTYYGGNGTSNFALPNLAGAVAVGQGQLPGGSIYDMGETGGASSVALTLQTGPNHTHSLMASITAASSNTPANGVLARSVGTGTPKAQEGKIYSTLAADTVINAPITPAGNGQVHDNTQPYLALTYCICMTGIFPPRG